MTAAPRHPGLEALSDGFCTVDAGGRVAYWNAAAERWFGVPRDEAAGRELWELVPGAPAGALREAVAAAAALGGGARVRGIRAPDGRVLSAEASPMDEGAAVHFRDASEEERLAERYARLLESIRDGFLAVDGEWRIVYVNGAARSLLSLEPERTLGVSLVEHLPARPPELGAALRATMADGRSRHLDAVSPEGRLYRGRRFDVGVHALAGGGISILFQDVSDRLEREAELARLAAEAEDANRAKSRFFAAVSHELRTPLHAIVGYTHLLATGTFGGQPEGATRAAERASTCAEHLSRLIDDVLLLTTTEIDRLPVYPAPVEIPAYLPAVLELQRHQAEAKGLHFALEVADGVPAVETDPERLRQLLHALVANAVKFTSRGQVRVAARAVEARERPRDLRVGSAPAGWVSAVELTVEDTGPGIAPADRARIFEAFEQVADDARTDSINRGTGLGLTIARQLTRLLGGALELESAPGQGTTVRVRLPVSFGNAVA